MARPRVSAVMPAYNSETYIREAIESLLSQTFSELEVIVVDGTSTDKTPGIVMDLAAQDPRVRLDQQPRTGIVDARNRGAALAEGDYLAFLDSDDVALPHRFERQVRFLDAHPSVAAVGGTIVVTDENLRPFLTVRYPADSARIAAILPEANVLAASASMIRVAAFRDVGGCRGPFKQGAEDYDLWLRLSERYDLANLPYLMAYYRTHSSQVSSTGVERFVLPTVAAQLSARSRRGGRADPYGSVGQFTYDLFRTTEPNRDEVDRAILEVAAGQATYLALIGQSVAAQTLLDWATRTAGGSRARSQTLARVQLAQGVVAWKSRRIGSALLAGAHATVLDPQRAVSMVIKGLRARVFPH